MRTGLVIGLLAAVAFGCGSSGPSLTTACTERAQASCALRDSCSAGHGVANHYGDLTTCVSREAQLCELNVKAPGSKTTAQTVEVCAKSLPSTTCPDFYNNVPSTACIPPPGTRANGQACGANTQCVTGYCAILSGVACGVCADLPVQGAPCVDPGVAVRGFGCLKTTSTWAALGSSGGPCTADSPCGDGLACVTAAVDGGAAGPAGTCQAQGTTPGTTCDNRLQTAPDCDRTVGVVCPSHRNAVCEALLYATAAQPCGRLPGDVDGGVPDGGVPPAITACTNGGACVTAPATDGGAALTGTCVAPAAESGACDTDLGPPCLGPARCIGATTDAGVTTGTCQLVDPASCN
jgi:hypothetical protein